MQKFKTSIYTYTIYNEEESKDLYLPRWEPSDSWRLTFGIHSCSYSSRDHITDVMKFDSYQAVVEEVKKQAKYFASNGYYLWYAYAASPDGTPYRVIDSVRWG